MAAVRSLRLLTLGDLLLDVLVDGDFTREYDGAGTVQLYPGGSAANFAAGAARAGAAIRFVGCVGDDAAGALLIPDLQDRGVEAAVRKVAGGATGTVLVLRNVEGPGSSRMWSNPGASLAISPADFDPAWFAGLDGLHLTGYSLLRPAPRPAALHALATARAARPNLFFSLDPNPAHLLAGAGPSTFRELIANLRPELLLPNLEEGALLAGCSDPGAIVDSLLEVSPLVALTLGAAGCLVGWGRERRTVPAVQVAVADATGAGDAFAAGFVTAYLATRDPVAAGEAGVRAAAGVVARAGAR